MRILLIGIAVALLSAQTAAAEFSMSFSWGNIPRCTTGKPNRVGSPKFVLKGVPAGTTSVDFRLKDLNVPGYNHGGGKVKVSGNGTVPAGSFRYKSPCPPNGRHTYEWTATARGGGKVLAKARARRNYP